MGASELRDPETLKDRMWNVSQQTDSRGLPRASIDEVAEWGEDNQIVVRYTMPNNAEHKMLFTEPEAETGGYRFVRLLKNNSLGLDSMKEMEDQDYVKTVENDSVHDKRDYDLYVPPEPKSMKEKLNEKNPIDLGEVKVIGKTVMLATFYGVLFPIQFKRIIRGQTWFKEDVVIATMVIGVLLFVWWVVVAFLGSVVVGMRGLPF